MKENPLLSEASDIAQAMYRIADSIETEQLDEKWRTASKLKNAANDSYFYVAQVTGGGKNQALEFDCISARKHLNTLRAMYAFASKEQMVEIDPELVLKIDKLVAQIDAEQEAGQKEMKRKTDVELKPWFEKYRIWQKISKDY